MSHARLAPSNHRWPHCPGSVREEAAYPDIPGEAAIDGTGSHLLLEMVLNGEAPDCQPWSAQSFLGHLIGANHEDRPQGWEVKQDRIDRVNICLNYIKTRYEQLKQQYGHYGHQIVLKAESRSDAGKHFGRDDWYGTVDITLSVISANNDALIFCEIVDYKDGVIWVEVENNSQLISYGTGKVYEYPQSTGSVSVQTTIVQPKTSRPIRSHLYQFGKITTLARQLAEAAAKTDDPNAPLIPDNKGGKGWCMWCKHKENCSEQSNKSLEVMKKMSNETTGSLFEQVSSAIEKIDELTVEELAELFDAKPGMMEIFDRVQKEIEHRIDTGIDVPGYAMLPGKGKRQWNVEDDELIRLFKGRRLKKDEMYVSSLISPAQFEKLTTVKKPQRDKFIAEYVTEKPGSLALQKVAYQKPTAEEMFAGVTTTTAENTDQVVEIPQF